MASFVIKRKRKRAADPCLGFYQSDEPLKCSSSFNELTNSATSLAPISPPNGGASPLQPIRTPGFSAQDYYLNVSPVEKISTLTVEEFLQSTAGRAKKSYGRKRRLVKLARSSSGSRISTPSKAVSEVSYIDPEAGPLAAAATLASDSTSPTLLPRRGRKKRSKPFAEHMTRIAVLAHVDLSPSLRGEAGLSRKSLCFTREREVSPIRTASMRRVGSLVDPRKNVPFGQACFASPHTQNPPGLRPLTTWSTGVYATGVPAPASTKKPRYCSSRVRADFPQQRQPLQLIPLRDAEAAYVVRLSASNDAHDAVAKQTHMRKPLFSQNISNSSRTPLNFVENQAVPVSHHNCHGVALPQAESECLSSSAAALGNHLSLSPSTRLIPCESPLDVSVSLPKEQRIYDDTQKLQSAPPRVVTPTATKPLKALASFLDEFMETARNATHVQASTTARPRKRLQADPTSSTRHSANTLPLCD